MISHIQCGLHPSRSTALISWFMNWNLFSITLAIFFFFLVPCHLRGIQQWFVEAFPTKSHSFSSFLFPLFYWTFHCSTSVVKDGSHFKCLSTIATVPRGSVLDPLLLYMIQSYRYNINLHNRSFLPLCSWSLHSYPYRLPDLFTLNSYFETLYSAETLCQFWNYKKKKGKRTHETFFPLLTAFVATLSYSSTFFFQITRDPQAFFKSTNL